MTCFWRVADVFSEGYDVFSEGYDMFSEGYDVFLEVYDMFLGGYDMFTILIYLWKHKWSANLGFRRRIQEIDFMWLYWFQK